jgi:hypothetical protein
LRQHCAGLQPLQLLSLQLFSETRMRNQITAISLRGKNN